MCSNLSILETQIKVVLFLIRTVSFFFEMKSTDCSETLPFPLNTYGKETSKYCICFGSKANCGYLNPHQFHNSLWIICFLSKFSLITMETWGGGTYLYYPSVTWCFMRKHSVVFRALCCPFLLGSVGQNMSKATIFGRSQSSFQSSVFKSQTTVWLALLQTLESSPGIAF